MKITTLMFYSCRADQRDTKTASRFILQSDAEREAEQEVTDLQGSLSETSQVTRARRHFFGSLLTRQLSLISAATERNVGAFVLSQGSHVKLSMRSL